jgi:hypothetical protein
MLRGGKLNLRTRAFPGRRCTSRQNFKKYREAKDNRKIPWSVLLFGKDAGAPNPAGMLTQCVRQCQ